MSNVSGFSQSIAIAFLAEGAEGGCSNLYLLMNEIRV
jgi:hypothetical protein